jgi:DNA gyrase subunit B
LLNQFEGQTKTKLGNREVVSPVSQVSEMIENYLKKIQMMPRIIVQKSAAQARHAAKSA